MEHLTNLLNDMPKADGAIFSYSFQEPSLAYVKLDAKLCEVKSLSHLANTWLVTIAVWQTRFASSSADDQKVQPVVEVISRERTICSSTVCGTEHQRAMWRE